MHFSFNKKDKSFKFAGFLGREKGSDDKSLWVIHYQPYILKKGKDIYFVPLQDKGNILNNSEKVNYFHVRKHLL